MEEIEMMFFKKGITDEMAKEKIRCEKARTSFLPLYEVKEGDVFEIVKGKKYTIGQQFTVTGIYEWATPHGSTTVDYLLGDGIKVAKHNCKFIRGYSEVA